MRKLIWVASGLLVGLICAGIIAEVQAGRNSSGTMSLTTPGVPFQANQQISSTQVNNTLNDIATELTNSLERNGKGGMLAALRGIDGTLAAPALSWTSETGSGLFRNTTNDVRMSIGGTLAEQWTTAAVLPALPLRAANGLVSAPSLSFANDTGSGFYRSASNDIRMAINGTDSIRVVNPGTRLTLDGATVSGWWGLWAGTNGDSPSSTNYSFLAHTTSGTLVNSVTGGTVDLRVNNVTKAQVTGSGFVIGTSGTAISNSIRGTASWTPGTVAGSTCSTTAITVTGATAGTECVLGIPSAQTSTLTFACVVSSNTCTVNLCNTSVSGAAGPSGTYACRVFNP